MTNSTEPPFWELPLGSLDDQQWEALCDGCGRCCLVKLEDESSGELSYTGLHCEHLDADACRCSRYTARSRVPGCMLIERNFDFSLLPTTCAYRLRAGHQPLPDWHPLLSGRRDSVFEAGIAVRGRTLSAAWVHPEEHAQHLINWVEV